MLLFLHKIRANTVRKRLILSHSHHCQNSAQRNGRQGCLGHSPFPGVKSDQIQITCYASCLILSGSENLILFKMKLPSIIKTIKTTLKYWQKNLSFFECLPPSHNSKPTENINSVLFSLIMITIMIFFFSGLPGLI